MKKRAKKAQSVLEYVLIISAIIAVIIFAARQWINPAVTSSLTDANTAITNAAGQMPQYVAP